MCTQFHDNALSGSFSRNCRERSSVAASRQEKFEHRAVIPYLLKGLNAKDIHAGMQHMVGNDAPRYLTVKKGVANFKHGETNPAGDVLSQPQEGKLLILKLCTVSS